MTRVLPVSVLLALGAAACGNPMSPAQPPSFDRPESVSFFCWDKTNNVPVSLDNCAPVAPEAGDDDLGRPGEPYELHAVVTQTASGEAAAVQVTTDEQEDTSGVVDSDIRLPGFTFAAVGEVPSAVVTPRTNPAFTYVVNRGSSDLHVVETVTFRSGLGANVIVHDANELGWDPDARPSAMVLTPDQDAVIVALPGNGEPDTGRIVRLPIDGMNVGPAEELTLGSFDSTMHVPVDLSVLMNSERPPEYVYRCGEPADVEIEWAAPRTPVELGDTPSPWALAIDEETNTVLVADRAQPMIHVVDLETWTELEPIVTSVPVRDIAITPRVPATVTDDPNAERTERFIYAIDEMDRSVLAIDYSDRLRPSYGGVLSMRSVAPFDRLTQPDAVIAQALEVVTPGYSEEPLAFCEDENLASPIQLHGVFLSVAGADGRVRFYDVFDLDTTCRGNTCAPEGADDEDQIVAIGRHTPRIGHFVEDRVRVTPVPAWQITGGTAPLEEDGTTNAPDSVPALRDLECPMPLSQVFPSEGATSLVCAVTDPFAARPQVISVDYQAAIPGTPNTGGNYDRDAQAIEVRFDPCALGVIGGEDVPSSGDLSSYEGDVVAITGPLPLSLSEDDHMYCSRIVNESASLETEPLIFPLRRARSGGIRDSYSGVLELGEPVGAAYTLDDIARCYPELLELEVRVNGVFLVISSVHGLLHPIAAGADGYCTVDPMAGELERGHAFFGDEFHSSYVAFSLGERPLVPDESSSITFTIGEVPSPLALEIGADTSEVPSLLTELVYNDVDERLYAVDSSVSGLVRIRLTDLATQGRFR